MNISQNLRCLVCNFKSNNQEIFKHLRCRDQWDLFECPECTFQFWWPMEQNNQESWWKEKSSATYKKLDVPPQLAIRHKSLLNTLPLEKGSILDIGCGEGIFLYEMAKRNFDVYGVDIDKLVIEKARKQYKLKNLYPISIYDFKKIENIPKFNLITFFEVLEHIGDPQKFIIIVKTLLNNNGFIAFSVPDVKTYGPWEERLNVPPHHFTRWSIKTLKLFLANNGFGIISVKKIYRPDSTSILMNTLMKLFKKKPFSIKFLNEDIKALWKYISLPLREFLYLLNIRPTIFVIAQIREK